MAAPLAIILIVLVAGVLFALDAGYPHRKEH